MNEILELPEVHCPGCDGRDRIIQSLAKEIDRRDEVERNQRTLMHAEKYVRETEQAGCTAVAV